MPKVNPQGTDKNNENTSDTDIRTVQQINELPQEVMNAYLFLAIFNEKQHFYVTHQTRIKYSDIIEDYFIKNKDELISIYFKFQEKFSSDENLQKKMNLKIKNAIQIFERILRYVTFIKRHGERYINDLNNKVKKHQITHDNIPIMIQNTNQKLNESNELGESIQKNITVLKQIEKAINNPNDHYTQKLNEVIKNIYNFINQFNQAADELDMRFKDMKNEIISAQNALEQFREAIKNFNGEPSNNRELLENARNEFKEAKDKLFAFANPIKVQMEAAYNANEELNNQAQSLPTNTDSFDIIKYYSSIIYNHQFSIFYDQYDFQYKEIYSIYEAMNRLDTVACTLLVAPEKKSSQPNANKMKINTISNKEDENHDEHSHSPPEFKQN